MIAAAGNGRDGRRILRAFRGVTASAFRLPRLFLQGGELLPGFVLLFGRQFTCMSNGKNRDVSSRITDLLERYGLTNRTDLGIAESASDPIDWKHVQKMISMERSKGSRLLKQILEL